MSKQKNVVFATPSYSHAVSLEYFRMVLEVFPLLNRAGINSGFSVIGGDQFIAKARNLLVAMFLAHPEATDLFFLDDDISCPAENIVKFINRPEDVILGAYPKKQANRDFPVELAGNRETGELIERDGLVRVIGGPTGFMRIRRHVLERMAQVSNVLIDHDTDDKERRSPNIFKTGVGGDGLFYGEDWLFCQEVQAQGFEVWCDPDIEFTHRGHNVWRDKLSLHLDVYRAKGKVAAQKLADEAKEAVRGEENAPAQEPGQLASPEEA